MSRSRRKTPIFGCGGGSEKRDKQIWHKKFRHGSKQKLKDGFEDEDYSDPNFKEYSDPWIMNKDGKYYYPEATKKDMRK